MNFINLDEKKPNGMNISPDGAFLIGLIFPLCYLACNVVYIAFFPAFSAEFFDDLFRTIGEYTPAIYRLDNYLENEDFTRLEKIKNIYSFAFFSFAVFFLLQVFLTIKTQEKVFFYKEKILSFFGSKKISDVKESLSVIKGFFGLSAWVFFASLFVALVEKYGDLPWVFLNNKVLDYDIYFYRQSFLLTVVMFSLYYSCIYLRIFLIIRNLKSEKE